MDATPAHCSGTVLERAHRRVRRVTTSGRSLPQVEGIRWRVELSSQMRGAPMRGAAAGFADEEPSSEPVRV
jgi:hypothetical protein